ncbi:helix-turn-helix domain-containing protein [Uniformispora flossi]|uniref:helix-turn-helix domain-containing protein n=1 Tax=Uniformispora flossi TaxID=3390723 RepID=UPI003C2CB54A
MPRSPSSTVQAARNELGVRLRELRKEAPLSGRELARLENGETLPSVDDIRIWCRVCGADHQAEDLIAATRTVDSMYVQWKRVQRTGLRRLQESYVPLFERTQSFRVYSSNVVPGLLQTEGYATALLTDITEFRGTVNDVLAAVEARMERSRVLRQGRRRFAFLIEESVLRHRVGDDDAMADQLGYLLSAMAFPTVSIGVIPLAAPRHMWVVETFSIYDAEQAQVETLTAAVTMTAPGEVAVYAKAFAELGKVAVYGQRARSLVAAAVDSLG